MRREYEDDDGRTIADMSDLPDVSIVGRWSGIHKAAACSVPSGHLETAVAAEMLLTAADAAGMRSLLPKWTAANAGCMFSAC